MNQPKVLKFKAMNANMKWLNLSLLLLVLAGMFIFGIQILFLALTVIVVDLVFEAARDTSIEEINTILKQASQGELKDILAYNDLPLVSVDFNHNPASSIYDASETKVIGRTVKVLSWYDNEWGFSNRMLDTSLAMFKAR